MTLPAFDPLFALLITSLLAAAVLALMPDYRWSARFNILASFLVLVFALLLFRNRPPLNDILLADDLNVVFIALNAFVGFTTSVFSASYIGHELETGRLTLRLSALLPCHVPADDVRHGSRADGQQHRTDVGRHRAGDAVHHHDGRHLPHARGAGGRLEILHPGKRRHRAGAVRNHPGLPGGGVGHRRGHGRDGLDEFAAPRRCARPVAAQHRVCFPAARLRHQSRPGAHACLVAGCPCGRTDAGFRRALGIAAERGAVRTAALQDDRRGESRHHPRGTADDHAGFGLADLRRLHAGPAPRHQTPVRLFVHRAHGHHRIRLRHGRSRSATSPACCK